MAERRPYAAYNYRLSLFIENIDQGIRISSSIEPAIKAEGLAGLGQNTGHQKKEHEKLEKKFYDAVASLLYK